MYYVSAMRSDALVHAPSSPVKRIHLVGRRTGQRLGDAPIVHTIAPPALLAAHPVLPHCGSSVRAPCGLHHTSPWPTPPWSARLLTAPLQHTSARAAHPTNHQFDVAPGTGL